MANPSDPTTNDVTNALIANALDRAQRSFPAIVSSYDGATMRAVVQPALRILAKNGQQVTPTPVEVPVAWPSWGDIVIQGKLREGDEVVVECMDKNWRPWLLDGGVRDYNSIGGRGAGYGMAKPFQLSATRRPGALRAGDEVTIGRRDGLTTVALRTDGTIRLQAVDVELTLGAGLADFLTSLHTAISGWVPVPNDGAASLKTALTPWLLKVPPTGGPAPS